MLNKINFTPGFWSFRRFLLKKPKKYLEEDWGYSPNIVVRSDFLFLWHKSSMASPPWPILYREVVNQGSGTKPVQVSRLWKNSWETVGAFFQYLLTLWQGREGAFIFSIIRSARLIATVSHFHICFRLFYNGQILPSARLQQPLLTLSDIGIIFDLIAF